MTENKGNKLEKSDFIRHKLFDDDLSSWKRYAMLVVGEPSFWKLLKYELITLFFGPLPGALGLALRKFFYPTLFKKSGKGVVFGRSVVIRNSHRITVGDGVVIDDYALLDARGAGNDGIVIGDSVIINRDVFIISKVGPISIGAGSDIGARSMVISTGGIRIGEKVSLAGSCKVGGSVAHLEGDGRSAQSGSKTSKGEVVIGDGAILYMSVIVLDGVTIGERAVIASGMTVQNDIPGDSIIAVHQKLVYLNRVKHTEDEGNGDSKEPTDGPKLGEAELQAAKSEPNELRDATIAAVFAAIDDLNMLRPKSERIVQSMDTVLGELDSMDKVNLIVETEQKLSDQLGRSILLDGQALVSRNDKVFDTVETFVGEVAGLIVD